MIKKRGFEIRYFKQWNSILITVKYTHSGGSVTWIDYVVTALGLDGIE